MADEQKPTYPDFPCHLAELKPARAPEPECECKVCRWLRDNVEWEAKRGRH